MLLTFHKIYALRITNDNRYVISAGSLDKTIKIWETNTGKCLKTLDIHTGEVTLLLLIYLLKNF